MRRPTHFWPKGFSYPVAEIDPEGNGDMPLVYIEQVEIYADEAEKLAKWLMRAAQWMREEEAKRARKGRMR